MHAINLAQKLATFSGHWQPRTVGEFNGHDLMVVKVKGEFTWHKHEDTDDFFLVLQGRLTMRLRDGDVSKAVEHCPVAEDEVHMLLIERTGTPNSGDPATAAPRRVI
jgi:mannose-6-phosphate isomerase-like protein (cupin superfamily)